MDQIGRLYKVLDSITNKPFIFCMDLLEEEKCQIMQL